MSSRYLKDLEIRRSKIIHIYRNGDAYSRATFVILRLPEQMELNRIIKAIEEKVKLPLNKPIRKLFEMSGTVVQSPTQIEDGKYYVAASTENFFSLEYGQPGNWVLVGPVRTSKYANVRFVTKSEEEGKPVKLSTSNSILSPTKSTKRSSSPTKTKTKKANLSKKQPVGSKKYFTKNMVSSEHADKILDTYGTDDANKPEEEPEGKEDIQPEEILNTLSNEENICDEESNVDQSKTCTTDIQDPQTILDHTQESENLVATHDEPITKPGESQEENTDILNQPSHEPEMESHKDLTDGDVKVADDLSKVLPDDKEDNSEVPKELQDEADSRVRENGSSEVLEANEEESVKDPDDLENHAATKIQATFRGFQVRSEMAKSKTEEFQDSVDESAENSEITNNTDNI